MTMYRETSSGELKLKLNAVIEESELFSSSNPHLLISELNRANLIRAADRSQNK